MPDGPEDSRNPYESVLHGGPSGHYTYVRPVDLPDGPAIRIVWRALQGAEFTLLFSRRVWRDEAASAILDRFASASDRTLAGVRDIQGYVRSGRYDGPAHHREYTRIHDVRRRQTSLAKGEFETFETTLLPHMLVSLVPHDTMVVVTPTSTEARQELLRVGIDAFGRDEIAYPIDMLPDPVEVEKASLIYVDGDVRVEDRGEAGVCLVFREPSEGTPSSSWFVDSAADRIRDLARDAEALDRFVRGRIADASAPKTPTFRI